MRPCPVCGGTKHVPLFPSANRHGRHLQEPATMFGVVKCEGCGLMGLADVVADSAYYRRYYPHGYHEDAQGVLSQWWGCLSRNLLHRKIKTIIRLSVPKTGRRRLLDVGCGPGHFLAQLDRSVFEPRGLEPVGAAVAAAQKRGLAVSQGDVLLTPLGEAEYDVVTLWHVLEHIDQPDVALSRIHAALDAHGIVVITTPNTHSCACRIGREYWFHLDSPRHLHLFNECNLVRLLKKCGFEVVHRAYLPFDFPLDFFWSVWRKWRMWPLLTLYPVTKQFDHENLWVIARKM